MISLKTQIKEEKKLQGRKTNHKEEKKTIKEEKETNKEEKETGES